MTSPVSCADVVCGPAASARKSNWTQHGFPYPPPMLGPPMAPATTKTSSWPLPVANTSSSGPHQLPWPAADRPGGLRLSNLPRVPLGVSASVILKTAVEKELTTFRRKNPIFASGTLPNGRVLRNVLLTARDL